MSFSTTTTEPRIDATVTIRFAGLMVLKPGAGNTCEVGIHRLSPFHTFQAMLIVNKPGLPLTFIRLTTGHLTSALSFDVVPAPAGGFSAFAQDPFARNDQSHPKDHRWALNMRELPNHANVEFNDFARPAATINGGVLYTGNRTRPGLNLELQPAQPGTTLPTIQLQRGFAADLAVAIDNLTPPNVLSITWEESGQSQQLILPRDLDLQHHAGTTYTISLMNDPPTFDPLPHDELALYYRVLRDGSGNPIPTNKQYRVKDPQNPASDEIPCMPVTLLP